MKTKTMPIRMTEAEHAAFAATADALGVSVAELLRSAAHKMCEAVCPRCHGRGWVAKR